MQPSPRRIARFGRLDVVINNAGYGLFGAIEEVSEERSARPDRDKSVRRSVGDAGGRCPIMRAQGSGHIIQISSIGGVNAFPNLGLYHASKWALEGFSQALAASKSPSTAYTSRSSSRPAFQPTGPGHRPRSPNRSPPINGARDRMKARRANVVPGDPAATGAAMLALVDAAEPPLQGVLRRCRACR